MRGQHERPRVVVAGRCAGVRRHVRRLLVLGWTMNRAEEWRAIPGYEGIYEVSDYGRVRSLDRIVLRSNGHCRLQRGRLLRLMDDGRGYRAVTLSRGGRTETGRVHRLVLLAFVGAPEYGQEGCHGNGDRADNRLANLRWGTHSENVRDSIKHGTHSEVRKTECPSGHPLIASNLLPSALPKRRCWECHRARGRKAA